MTSCSSSMSAGAWRLKTPFQIGWRWQSRSPEAWSNRWVKIPPTEQAWWRLQGAACCAARSRKTWGPCSMRSIGCGPAQSTPAGPTWERPLMPPSKQWPSIPRNMPRDGPS